VQFNTAAEDKRIDAIVPEISWGDLVRDLLPGGVLKQTWDLLLYGAGGATAATLGIWSPAGPQTGIFAPEIHMAFAQGAATGELDESLLDWFSMRSTTRRSGRIDAPTLIIQGTVDTLFPLNDGFENYRNLVGAGTPVKLMTYCSGHTLGCDYPGGASGDPKDSSEARPVFERRILAWIDRYVRNKRVDTGAPVEWQAQDGFYYGAPSYPLPETRMGRRGRLKTSRSSDRGRPAATGSPMVDPRRIRRSESPLTGPRSWARPTGAGRSWGFHISRSPGARSAWPAMPSSSSSTLPPTKHA
jgi:ABC-2 type transport system ATP-binding protein